MPLKKPTGDMYNFIDAIWNPASGRCSHNCSYCYVARIMGRFRHEMDDPHINEGELKCNLGKNKTIFVCSGCDLFAEDIPGEYILAVVNRTLLFPENKYIFQTKNPKRIISSSFCLSTGIHKICTTIETNRYIPEVMRNVPPPIIRAEAMKRLSDKVFETMVTVEPIMDFDLEEMLKIISMTRAAQVNIGADSGGNSLPEPSRVKVITLISELENIERSFRRKIYGGC